MSKTKVDLPCWWRKTGGRFIKMLKSPLYPKTLFCILLLAVLTLPLQAIGIEDTGSAKVIRVVDGDTLRVNYKGNEERIRLIGIDAPESKPNKKAKNDAQRSGEDVEAITAMGKELTNFVKTLVKPGDTVKIEFDVEKRDRYRRLLAYVYFSDGKMLNEEVVKAGYAVILENLFRSHVYLNCPNQYFDDPLACNVFRNTTRFGVAFLKLRMNFVW